MAIAACLQTRVKNTSGKKLSFGFLPPHGRKLDVDEIVAIDGDLMARLFASPRANRLLKSLNAALANGDLAILESPATYVVDNTSNAVKVLDLNSGSLAAVNPCWGTATAT